MDCCRALGAVDFDFMRYKVGMAIAVGGDLNWWTGTSYSTDNDILYFDRCYSSEWGSFWS